MRIAHTLLLTFIHTVRIIILAGGMLRMRAREVEKIIKSDGWYYVKQVGSHRHYKHPTKSGKVTIPFHTGDVDKGTVKSILSLAGIK